MLNSTTKLTAGLQAGWKQTAQRLAPLPEPAAWPLERRQEPKEVFMGAVEGWTNSRFIKRALPAAVAVPPVSGAAAVALSAAAGLAGEALTVASLGVGGAAGLALLFTAPKLMNKVGELGERVAEKFGVERRIGKLAAKSLAIVGTAAAGVAIGMPWVGFVTGAILAGRLQSASHQNIRRESTDSTNYVKALKVENAARTHELSELAKQLGPEQLQADQSALQGRGGRDWTMWATTLANQADQRLSARMTSGDLAEGASEDKEIKRDQQIKRVASSYLLTHHLLSSMASLSPLQQIATEVALIEDLAGSDRTWEGRAQAATKGLQKRFEGAKDEKRQRIAALAKHLHETNSPSSLNEPR